MQNELATIVNVDDHEVSLYTRSRVLRQYGYTVLEAKTGLEALDLIRRHRPHLVVLDVHLPDIDGLEVCSRIKQDSDLAFTPVLQISASAVTDLDRISGLERGADTYLVEPVDVGVLLATVRALLRLRRMEMDLKEANEELLRSNEALAQFAHAASHDLQEPLRTISIYSELLQRKCGDQLSSEGHGYLSLITDSTGRMQRLVKNLLAYSRVGGTATVRDVDLNVVLEDARGALDAALPEALAEIVCSPLPVVAADHQELVQVMMNLIGNSLKYRGQERPHIRITARILEGMWQISIHDNGIGFDPRYGDYIFGAFKRLDQGDVPGTGIGLAICKRVIEKYGGRIWADGKPGEGATFSFTLPPGTDRAATGAG